MKKLPTTGVVSDETKTSTGGYARLADARPILFSGQMVKAILDGDKTQTRRLVKFGKELPNCATVPLSTYECGSVFHFWGYGEKSCPYGAPGDILWVRETWQQEAEFIEASSNSASWDCDWWESTGSFVYRADGTELPTESEAFGKWKPGIHMPKTACRLFLKIKSIRVERLQQISRGDAMDEGCPFANMADGPNPVDWFSDLWESINGVDSWGQNPWVWVVEFERAERPTGFC